VHVRPRLIFMVGNQRPRRKLQSRRRDAAWNSCHASAFATPVTIKNMTGATLSNRGMVLFHQ
jgi:hypothetical protein